jgi:hypothetical protein
MQCLKGQSHEKVFEIMGAVDVKPVSLICTMLLQTAASYRYRGSQKNLLRLQTFSWDCPLNSGKSKKLNLESKAVEDINRPNYNLIKACFSAYWAVSDFTADCLSTPNFRKRMPKPHDEIS